MSMGERPFQRFLETFLAGFISRRSEYGGYWLFGFLFNPVLDLKIDLQVAAPLTGNHPIDVAQRRAEYLFFEKLSAHHLDPLDVTSALLSMRTQGQPISVSVAGASRRGQTVIVAIDTVYKGTPCRAECARFVAPHDPDLEQVSEPPFDEVEERDT